jgi:hypothetical protein
MMIYTLGRRTYAGGGNRQVAGKRLPILALSQSSLDGWNSTKPVSQVLQPFRGKLCCSLFSKP